MKKGLGSKTEKAGVGGSTPSLATIIPNNLAASSVDRLVRSQSAAATRFLTGSWSHMIVKDLVEAAFSLGPLSVRF